MSKNSLIIDFETVSNAQVFPDTAVASVAMIAFDPAEQLSFEELVNNALRIKFNLGEQYAMGRRWDQETVDWWKKEENTEAFKAVIQPHPSDVSIREMNSLICNYLQRMAYDPSENGKVYSRGNAFDFPLFSNIYKSFGWEEPFAWWNIRDVRTEIDAVWSHVDPHHEGYGYIKEFPYPEGFIKHVETHDCARDILMMQYAHYGLLEKING